MLNLIIKDLVFYKKQVFLVLLAAIAIAVVMVKVSASYMMFALIMTPALILTQVVGRGCYADDKYDAYNFLKSMPLSKRDIVLSKYVECLFSLFFSYSLLVAIYNVLKFLGELSYSFNTQILLLSISSLLIYFSIYLWLFFKKDFASAQQTSFFLVIIIVGFFKVQESMKSITAFKSTIDPLYLLVMFAIVIFLISAKLSVSAFVVKE